MAFLGGLALLGSAGEAKSRMDREQMLTLMHQMAMQRQDQALQQLQQKHEVDALAGQIAGKWGIPGISGINGAGTPPADTGAASDSGNGDQAQYQPPPQQPPQQPPAAAAGPPPGPAGAANASGFPGAMTSPQQAQFLQALMQAGQARQQQGPPPGLPPPQQGGAPSFGDRFPGPGQAMQPPGQGDQMQPTPVQTQAFRPAGQQAPAQPAGFQKGKLYDVASPEEQAQLAQPQERGTQVAQMPKNDEELMQQLNEIPALKNNPEKKWDVFHKLHSVIEKNQGMQEHKREFEERRSDKQKKEREEKSEIKGFVGGLIDGTIPPDKIPMKSRVDIASEVRAQGVNLAKLTQQWQRAQAMIRQVSSQQSQRFLQTADTFINTTAEVKQLAKQLGLSNYPDFNTWKREYYKRFDPSSPQGRTATRYTEAVGALKLELAQLASAGYAPTESAWKEAREMLDSNWAPQRMEDALDEAAKLFDFRRNVILNSAPNVGFGPYGSGGQQPQQQQQQQPQQSPKSWKEYFPGAQ